MPVIVHRGNGGSDYWISVVVLEKPDSILSSALEKEAVDSLITQLAMNPQIGEIIPNSGGLRKVRVAKRGGGKSGGLRVVYLFHDLNMPLFIIAAYEKNKKERYTEKELAQMRLLGKTLVGRYATEIRNKIGLSSKTA